MILASERGLCDFDTRNGSRLPVEPMPDQSGHFRSNDCKVDPQGGLWWSIMDDAGGKRPGAVYRYVRGQNRLMSADIHIANSLAFSPDGRTVYLADSARRTIWRFAVDLDAGRLGERELFASYADGEPDGAAVDADGCLWVAVWDGWRVDRFLIDGSLDRSVAMPVARPTACAFGGKDLDTVYVTSARDGLSKQALAGQPWAGDLLAFEPGVQGLIIPPFAG